MDKSKQEKISNKLRKLLNREPTENEVINAQSDQNLMTKILEDDIVELREEMRLLKNSK